MRQRDPAAIEKVSGRHRESGRPVTAGPGLLDDSPRREVENVAAAFLDAIDEGRIGYVGFSLGAVVGTYLLAHDPRARVAVLALAGGARGPSQLDPVTYIGRGQGRPLLVVAAEDDKRVSVASSRALFDAARDPKEFLLSPGDHGQLSGKTLGRIQTFLKDEFVR